MIDKLLLSFMVIGFTTLFIYCTGRDALSWTARQQWDLVFGIDVILIAFAVIIWTIRQIWS
jgi:hypothetical protein